MRFPLMKLLSFEGQKGNDPCLFDGVGKFPLVHSAHTAHAAGENFSAFGDKLFEAVDVFIVDGFDLLLAESANLSAGDPLHGLSDGFLFHDISPFKILRLRKLRVRVFSE